MMCDTEIVEDMSNGIKLDDSKARREQCVNENQRTKLREIFVDETREYFKSESRIETLRLELKKLSGSSPAEKAMIDSKIDEIEAERETLSKIKAHVMRMRKACSRYN